MSELDPGSDTFRDVMSSVVILACQPNSHPFQERHISLLEPVKIGRSVARARPASNNGIFDCKVLSRNHAVVWYENGKFYLKDTKSSNGTFINNQRLSRGGEESAPREIFSGDHIQFGVDVMDNNKRGEKITHNCIIATVTLFHPDGREARNIYSESGQFSNTVTPGVTIQSQELYQLAQYLQEALHREKMLEQKLSTLQQLVDNTQEASENGWQALIDEDRLLSRLEVLENQLHIYSKNHADDTLRQEVVTLQEEKNTYETTAKESLKRVLEEKLEAVRKLSDLERSLHNTEDECTHLKDMCEKAQEELQALAEKYQDQQKEVIDIQEKLQEAERLHLEEVEKIKQEKEDLNEKLQDMIRQETILTAKMESLQADNDIALEQLAAMKDRLEAIKEPRENVIDEKENGEGLTNGERKTDEETESEDKKIIVGDDIKIIMKDDENYNKLEDLHKSDSLNHIQNHVDEVDSMKIISSEKGSLEDIQGKLKDAQKQIEKYKEMIRESDEKLNDSSEKLEAIQQELERAETYAKQYITKISSLEEQLKVSQHQNDNSSGLITELQDKVRVLESEIVGARLPPERMEATLVATCASTPSTVASQMDESNDSGLEDDDNLKELLREARILQTKAETELKKCKDELNVSKTEVQRKDEETSSLKDQLSDAQKLTDDQSKMVVNLQDQLRKAETQTKEVKQQILDLRGELDHEKVRNKETKKELDETKSKHQESQQAAKQSHNEAEQLKNKVRQLQERLDSERRTSSHHGSRSLHLDTHGRDTHSREFSHGSSSLRDSHHGSHRELHKTNSGGHTPSSPSGKQRGEFTALKEECSSLRKRIQAIEAEMKMSRKENLQLSAEYNKLQESYRQLEVMKDQLETQALAWQSNLTDSQKETEQTRHQVGEDSQQQHRGLVMAGSNVTGSPAGSPGPQLQETTTEVTSLRTKCQEYKDKVSELEVEMTVVHEQYKHLSDRTKVLSFASSIPLLMLLFAILMALYPTLAQITATTV